MGNITYEQFLALCKYWNYTIEEGHKAMCFTEGIINIYLGNCTNYAAKISNEENHSPAFIHLVENKKEDVIRLASLYGILYTTVFEMLQAEETK